MKESLGICGTAPSGAMLSGVKAKTPLKALYGNWPACKEAGKTDYANSRALLHLRTWMF